MASGSILPDTSGPQPEAHHIACYLYHYQSFQIGVKEMDANGNRRVRPEDFAATSTLIFYGLLSLAIRVSH